MYDLTPSSFCVNIIYGSSLQVEKKCNQIRSLQNHIKVANLNWQVVISLNSQIGEFVDKACRDLLFVWSPGSEGEKLPDGKGIKANEVILDSFVATL